MAELVLNNITKVFQERTIGVSDLNLRVEDGEFLVLVGPSGCGKSTILRLIAGLETPDNGTIMLDDREITHVAPKDRDMAMVFQNYALYPHMSVFDNLAFGLKMRKTPKDIIRQRVEKTAQTLNLGELLKRKSKALSGGQQQRIALGRAIIREPALFLFDEPLSNLDAKLRVSMRGELIKLHRTLGTTMLYVTHDQMEAMSMGSRLVVLNTGVIQQIGTPLEIYNKPRNMFVAGFLGSPSMNFLQATLERVRDQLCLRLGESVLHLPHTLAARLNKIASTGQKVIFGIRPEHILESDTTPALASLPFCLDFLEPLGSEVLATCTLMGQTCTVRLTPQTQLTAQTTVRLGLDLQHAILFDPESGEALA